MATLGPNYPGTTADDSAVGTQAWSNTDNAKTDNGTPASSGPNTAVTTHYLKVTNFGFAIDSGATITGITVEIDRQKEFACTVYDTTVKLLKAGSLVGDNKAATGTDWPSSYAVATYGSGSDLWGTTWTPAQVNASDFGVDLNTTNTVTGAPGFAVADVDYIRITITYTPAGAAIPVLMQQYRRRGD